MTEDIKDVIEWVRQFADSDLAGYGIGADLDIVLAHIDALTLERDDALTLERDESWAFAALRDQRDADMQSLMATNNELLAGRDAAAEAMRARCEGMVREYRIANEVDYVHGEVVDIICDIADAIAALKVESVPDPRDAENARLREALTPFGDAARSARTVGRPPFEFCDASDYARAESVLAKGGQR